MVKRVLKWVGIVLGVVLIAFGGFVGYQISAFNSSMSKVYDIPLPNIKASTDPNVIARGKHLAESVAGCAISDCHGSDLSGGKIIDVGPIGQFVAQNITPAGRAKDYSDGELARLIEQGVKKDGRSVRFMPVQDFNWLPDDDVAALVSYIRSVPPVDKPSQEPVIKPMGKVLDRMDKFILDVARRLDHTHRPSAPTPAPTAAYGEYVARLCMGCHGEHFSGGPIPGAPPSIPIPKNITPDDTGIKLYTYADFTHLLETGIKRDGKKLDKFMPVEALGHMNDTERQALWAFLRSLPPRPFGKR